MVHLAAAHVDRSIDGPLEFVEANVGVTLVMLPGALALCRMRDAGLTTLLLAGIAPTSADDATGADRRQRWARRPDWEVCAAATGGQQPRAAWQSA